MADVITHDGRKFVSLEYVLALGQATGDRPDTDLSFAEAFTIGDRGYVWFKEGWRKCAEQLRGSLGDL